MVEARKKDNLPRSAMDNASTGAFTAPNRLSLRSKTSSVDSPPGQWQAAERLPSLDHVLLSKD